MSTGFNAILNTELNLGLTDNAKEISAPSLMTMGFIADFADIFEIIDKPLATSWTNSDATISTTWAEVS